MVGVLFQPGAWWIGIHKSDVERRLCINVIPMLTVWVTLPGGRAPRRKSILKFGNQKPIDNAQVI